MASELKIHPNTAHKVVQHLIKERWLDVHPGIGTVVAVRPAARPGDRQRLLQYEVEQLVVESLRCGVPLEDVVDAIETLWAKLDAARDPVGARDSDGARDPDSGPAPDSPPAPDVVETTVRELTRK